MTRTTLNGWQRLGVIATVLWAIGALGLFLAERQQAADSNEAISSGIRRGCEAVNSYAQKPPHGCDADFAREHDEFEARWGWEAAFRFVFIGTIPAALCWLLIYSPAALYRWVRAGFHPRAH